MEFLKGHSGKSMNKKSFLRKGLKAMAAVLGIFLVQIRIHGKDRPPVDKVKMLTPDGKLVWVNKSVLNSKSPAPPISNKSLRSWIKSPKR